MKIDTIQMIEDFHTLLLNPNTKMLMFHKIQELKCMDSRILKKINSLKATFKIEIDRKDRIEFETGQAGQPFVLLKIEKRWLPAIPGEFDRIPFDIFPDNLIKEITDHRIKIGQGVIRRKIEIQEGLFEVSYTKEKGYYTGLLKNRLLKEQEQIKTEDGRDFEERLNFLEIMFEYLVNDRLYFEHAKNDFIFWQRVDQKGG